MSLLKDWLELAGGGALLYFGAEWFVAGASALALALRVPQILVGLTVVAYGTSLPEIIVGVQAARTGHGDVAFGNVVGSNIANIGLILGTAALIRPARVDGTLRRRELPILIVCSLVLPFLLTDGVIGPWESRGLLVAAFLYTAWMVREARSASTLAMVNVDAAALGEAADAAGAPTPRGSLRAAAVGTAGLGVLLVGGNLFVDGSVSVARLLGMSDRLVGLTIVAVGTSLPELVTSVIAARRDHSDIAIGNVVGSNIFNVLLCLGAAGLAGPLTVRLQAVGFDLVALIAMTAIAALFIRTERFITRAEGGVALGLYVVYAAITIAKG